MRIEKLGVVAKGYGVSFEDNESVLKWRVVKVTQLGVYIKNH